MKCSLRKLGKNHCLVCGGDSPSQYHFMTGIFSPLLEDVSFVICAVCLEKYCAKGLAARIAAKLYVLIKYWTDRLAVQDSLFYRRLESYLGYYYYYTGDF